MESCKSVKTGRMLNWKYVIIKDKNNHKAISYDIKDGKLVKLDFSDFVDWD